MLEYDRLVLFRLLMLFEQIQQVGTSKLFRKRNPLDFRFADAHIRFPYHVLNERTLELRPFPIEYFTRKRIIAYSLRTSIISPLANQSMTGFTLIEPSYFG